MGILPRSQSLCRSTTAAASAVTTAMRAEAGDDSCVEEPSPYCLALTMPVAFTVQCRDGVYAAGSVEGTSAAGAQSEG